VAAPLDATVLDISLGGMRISVQQPVTAGELLDWRSRSPTSPPQFRLLDAYASFLRAASEDSPLVIVLDDIRWADKPTTLRSDELYDSARRARDLPTPWPLHERPKMPHRRGRRSRVSSRAKSPPA
jgi:hypothetical protein